MLLRGFLFFGEGEREKLLFPGVCCGIRGRTRLARRDFFVNLDTGPSRPLRLKLMRLLDRAGTDDQGIERLCPPHAGGAEPIRDAASFRDHPRHGGQHGPASRPPPAPCPHPFLSCPTPGLRVCLIATRPHPALPVRSPCVHVFLRIDADASLEGFCEALRSPRPLKSSLSQTVAVPQQGHRGVRDGRGSSPLPTSRNSEHET